MKNARNGLLKLFFGALVVSSFVACNQIPEPVVLDNGDTIVAPDGSSLKIPGMNPVGDVAELQPSDAVLQKWVFPQEFPKACNTSANIVKNPKFMLGVVGSSNMPPATIANWQQANGTPQSSGWVMGDGNPVYAQMWGYKDGGEAIRQVGVPFVAGSYDVYISAVQFNETASVTPLRFRLLATTGVVANPWLGAGSNIIDDAVSTSITPYQTTWKKFGPYSITVPGGADTITIASSNTVPTAQAEPRTVSWGRYDNVCILPKQPEKADISIKKDLKAAPLNAGGLEQYVLTVNNAGPGSSSTPITVTDVLPAGLTLDSSFATTQGNWNCSVAGSTITCVSNTAISSGGSEQIVIPVNVTAQQGAIKNCASVSALNDFTPANNEACNTADVLPKPIDLAIKKQLLGATTLPAGGTTTYGLTVANLGGAINSGPVTVTDMLPVGLTLASIPTPANWNCAASTPSILSCSYTGSFAIPNGFTDNIAVGVTVSPKLLGKVENCALVNVAGDTQPVNNKSCIINSVKNKAISDHLATSLEDANTQLEAYLDSSATIDEATQKATVGLKDTLKTQVRLVSGVTLSPVDGLDNLFNVSDSSTGEALSFWIECHYSNGRWHCSWGMGDSPALTARTALNDVKSQLVRILEASANPVSDFQNLKEIVKSQVKLPKGISLTTVTDGENVFNLVDEGTGSSFKIKISGWVSFKPFTIGISVEF